MPVARVQMPDGRVARLEVPDGTTPQQVESFVMEMGSKEGVNWDALKDTVIDTGKNIGLGALSGAANIGATLLAPYDYVKDKITGRGNQTISGLVSGEKPMSSNEERRAQLRSFFTENATPESNAFRLGELGSEIAGTAGIGGAIAKGVRAGGGLLGATGHIIPKLASAIETGGFRLGTPAATTLAGKAVDIGLRTAGGAIAGGATAGLVNPEQAGTGAVLGAALPVAVMAAGAAGRGVRNALTNEVAPEVAQLYNVAKTKYGIDIPADRIANSRPMNALASSLEYVPLSGRQATNERMMSQLNAALSKTVGETGDNVVAALKRAETNLGTKFEQTLTTNGVKYDKPLLDDMVRNLDEARIELTKDQYKRIEAITNHIFDKANRTAAGTLELDGQAAYNIKKMLDRMGDSADSSLAYHARELKRSLMDGLDRSLGTQAAQEFKTLRSQYGNMLDLQGMVTRGAEGGVSIGRLAGNKNVRGDVAELADIAAQFVRAREGAHGAAQRVGLAAGAGAALANPGAIPVIAGGMAAGRATNAALNSQTVKDLILRTPQQSTYPLLSDPTGRATLYNLLSPSSQAAQQ